MIAKFPVRNWGYGAVAAYYAGLSVPDGGDVNPNFAVPAWFIDPANASGRASDRNDGTTATTPLRTYAELNRRWGGGWVAIPADTTITITYLSFPPAPENDPISLYALASDGIFGEIDFVFPSPAATPGVLTTVVGQTNTVQAHTTASTFLNVPANAFALIDDLDLGNALWLAQEGTNGAGAGSLAANDGAVGPFSGDNAQITLFGAGTGVCFPRIVAKGGAFITVQRCSVPFAGGFSTSYFEADESSFIVFSFVCFKQITLYRNTNVEYADCYFSNNTLRGEGGANINSGGFYHNGYMNTGVSFQEAGYWTFENVWARLSTFTTNCTCTGKGFITGVFFDNGLELLTGARIRCFRIKGKLISVPWLFNAVEPDAQILALETAAQTFLLDTTTLGGADLVRHVTSPAQATVNTGFAWNTGTHVYAASQAITVAKLDTSVAGNGFGGAALDPGGSFAIFCH